MVQISAEVRIIKDALKGDANTEFRYLFFKHSVVNLLLFRYFKEWSSKEFSRTSCRRITMKSSHILVLYALNFSCIHRRAALYVGEDF